MIKTFTKHFGNARINQPDAFCIGANGKIKPISNFL